MCERCKASSIRAAVALASAVYVAVEDRKAGDALSSTFSTIREGYKATPVTDTRQDTEFTPEALEKQNEIFKPLTSEEVSAALRGLDALSGAIQSAQSVVRDQIIKRVEAGNVEGLSPGHLKSARDFLAFKALQSEGGTGPLSDMMVAAIKSRFPGVEVEIVEHAPVPQFGVGKPSSHVS